MNSLYNENLKLSNFYLKGFFVYMTIPSRLTVLIIEKDPSQFARWKKWTEGVGFKDCFMVRQEATSSHFAKVRPDIAVLGRSLKYDSVPRCLQRLKIFNPSLPVYIIADHGHDTGCPHYSDCPFEKVYNINSEKDIDTEILSNLEGLLPESRKVSPPQDYPIVGQGEAIKKIREQILNLAGKDITVLVTGESGTGKELIARALHRYSKRSSCPLVKIQCGSMPDDLFESEVFGFQRGAFTGAENDKPGRLEIADGGTLFIDDVGDLSPYLQSKFLNIFEDKEFFRLGDILDKPIDARIIAATNVDLRKELEKGTFREDLFYRLNIVNITAPPLRHRVVDIPLLIDYFFNKYAYELEREISSIPESLIDCFMVYHWPGNIRELENLVRRILVVGDAEFVCRELERKNVTENANKKETSPGASAHVALSEDQIRDVFRQNNFVLKATTRTLVSEVEYQEILSALGKTNWNRRKAAELLKVSYKTVLNRIEEFDLKP